MGYPKELLYRALDIVKERKRAAERDAQERLEALEKKFPELRGIDESIAQSGLSAAKAVFSGGPDTKEVLTRLMEINLKNQKKLEKLLAREKLPPDYLSPRYTCAVCSDSGYDGKKMCACALTLAKKLAFEGLNAKSPLSLCGFDNFSLSYYSGEKDESRGASPRERAGEIFALCKAYAANFSRDSENLLFIGKTGLGKTHLSLAIAKSVLEKGFGVVYGSAQDLLNKIEREHFSRGENGRDTLELLISCDLLIFDDLGTEFTSPFIQSTVYNIINTRMLERRPTILSTNLSLAEIRAAYHERIVSRLVGGYTIQEFFGKDVRFLKKSGK